VIRAVNAEDTRRPVWGAGGDLLKTFQHLRHLPSDGNSQNKLLCSSRWWTSESSRWCDNLQAEGGKEKKESTSLGSLINMTFSISAL
jgi:hypothetical protein